MKKYFAALSVIVPVTLNSCASEKLTQPTVVYIGTNLDGWVKMSDGEFAVTTNRDFFRSHSAFEQGGNFTLTWHALHVEGGKGWLRTEREFGDFVLDAEWRGLETNYNSGFFVRAPLDGKPWATNIWQINTKQSAIGELLQGSTKIVKSVTPPVPVGEWVKFHAEAHGTNLTLDVNGKRVWEFHALEPARGFIGIQAEGKSFDFRNVKITALE